MACRTLCSKTASLNCGDEASCIGGCEATFGAPVCPSPFHEVLKCLVREPKESFECDSGTPTLREGHCEAEQAAAATCLEEIAKAAPQSAPASP